MTTVLQTVEAYRSWRSETVGTASLGFIPTMGGLHEGHLELVKRSLVENDHVAVSIFLNRTQFNKQEDYDKYPAVFEEDLRVLEELGVDAVFAPSYDDMYPDDYRYKISESQLSTELEGEHRPGHFDGVLTVVLKLLMVGNATRAYFGEKDWQQLQLVKGLVEAFFLPVEIVACPTIREESGLAMSSRNRRLSAEGLQLAARFNQVLNTAESEEAAMVALSAAGFEPEYVADRGDRRLGAVVLEGVRLIDNVERKVAR
ncbi:pantoate--beta-alanine ligase [Pelagicoccus sp. SDUM812002]|uniref:pantoate--beta-alanine ligase n=1 Tax=Pelagicoccus sp. SDUM812002 TaxID=3041266 RepID=UPI00280D47C3|nr:pantoate--beta-alanine ligase [Pelagicoccus sp. SDUM812002]MDQ8184937.1 pantoate--beta-alanine ligase [Pelagicoccus sp. SDUM812002]